MKIQELLFTGPRQVEISSAEIPAPGPRDVLVETWFSGISAGTEMLLYKGHAPAGMSLDENIPALHGKIAFPFKYGYAAVGKVVDAGEEVGREFHERLVFSFQPHQSHFLASQDDVFLLPEEFAPEQGVFLPNMETAVNFLMDGQPLIGENVAVFGQGIVGLLTTYLLSQFPLNRLETFDRYPKRLQAAEALGAGRAQPGPLQERGAFPGYDLVFELTGSPKALNQAINRTRFDGRIVMGSWYGEKKAALDLGGTFHRSRIRLISSQVSTVSPSHSGRWSKARRFSQAGRQLRTLPFEGLISHRFRFLEARKAFHLLESRPEEALQVVLVYPPGEKARPKIGSNED